MEWNEVDRFICDESNLDLRCETNHFLNLTMEILNDRYLLIASKILWSENSDIKLNSDCESDNCSLSNPRISYTLVISVTFELRSFNSRYHIHPRSFTRRNSVSWLERLGKVLPEQCRQVILHPSIAFHCQYSACWAEILPSKCAKCSDAWFQMEAQSWISWLN
jgi:predicted Zn-ribbon and HTH transcriptional regulator